MSEDYALNVMISSILMPYLYQNPKYFVFSV